MTSLIAGTARRPLRSIAQMVATPLAPRDFIDLIDPLSSSRDLRGRLAPLHQRICKLVMCELSAVRWTHPGDELGGTVELVLQSGELVMRAAGPGIASPGRTPRT